MNNPHSLIFLRSRKRGAVLAGMAGTLLALTASTFATPAQTQSADAPVKLLLRWYDTMPDDSLHNTRVQVAFHNGQFDVFDLGKPLPAVLAEWAGRNFTPVPEFHEAFLAAWPDAKISQIWNPKRPLAATIPSPGFNRPVPWQTVVTVNPAQHRFLSFFSLLHPANDAMVANEDPYQIELFNSQGRFRGPLLLNIRGNQVVDLGLCENNEAQLANLDVAEFTGQACTGEDGTVTWHPGLNGSHRNPDGQPQRVLGGSTSYVPSGSTGHSFYDPVNADFPGLATASDSCRSAAGWHRSASQARGTARSAPVRDSISNSSSRRRTARTRASWCTGTPSLPTAAASRCGWPVWPTWTMRRPTLMWRCT